MPKSTATCNNILALTFTAAPVVDDSYPFSADDSRRPTIEEEELFEMAMALITSGALEGT